MPQLSELFFQWQTSDALDIKFVVQVRGAPQPRRSLRLRASLHSHATNLAVSTRRRCAALRCGPPAKLVTSRNTLLAPQEDADNPGQMCVLVQQCIAVRDIVYESRKYKMTCTHTIVPGMIIEA